MSGAALIQLAIEPENTGPTFQKKPQHKRGAKERKSVSLFRNVIAEQATGRGAL